MNDSKRAVNWSRSDYPNYTTKEMHKALIKLLVGDTTCVLNASKATVN